MSLVGSLSFDSTIEAAELEQSYRLCLDILVNDHAFER